MKVEMIETFNFPPEIMFAVLTDIPHHVDWVEGNFSRDAGWFRLSVYPAHSSNIHKEKQSDHQNQPKSNLVPHTTPPSRGMPLRISNDQKSKKENIMTWSNWKTEDIGIKVKGTPAVSSWKEGRLDVFVRSTADHLYHRVYENDKWQGARWEDISDGHTIEAAPGVVSREPNRIDLFAVFDKGVHHRVFANGKWNNWVEDLKGGSRDALAAASFKAKRVDVFLRDLPDKAGASAGMSNRHWEDGVFYEMKEPWAAWKNLAGSFLSAPAAVGSGADRIDCFARGAGDRLFHAVYDGKTTAGWSEIDTAKFKDAPAAASAPTADKGRVDVFVRDMNDVLKHRVYYKDGWEKNKTWDDVGGKIYSAPATVAWWTSNVVKRIDCFAQGDKNDLIHTWWK